jgi:hypothetical protein
MTYSNELNFEISLSKGKAVPSSGPEGSGS